MEDNIDGILFDKIENIILCYSKPLFKFGTNEIVCGTLIVFMENIIERKNMKKIDLSFSC